MSTPEIDTRSPERRARDEKIAAEPPMPRPELPPGSVPMPLEHFHPRTQRRPIAVSGIVENGLVRPLDPSVHLTEHASVIIVMTE